MNNHQNFGQMKAHARRGLEGHYGTAILVFINVQIMSLFPAFLLLYLFPGKGLFSVIIGELASLILSAFIGILQAGVSLFYLKLLCGQPASTTDIFYGFKVNRNQALEISFTLALISMICAIPSEILSFYSSVTGTDYTLAIRLLLLTGNLLYLIITIPLQQSFFILLDFPNYSGKEVLQYSMRVMKGHFLRYLLFAISFIPLILLGILSCGIGLIWVMPYIEASFAAFYLDLMRNRP